MSWKRWFKYGKARVAAAARDLDDAVEKKEKALAADRDRKPWLADDDEVPSFDDAKARIEHEVGSAPPVEEPVDLAERQRAADDRLAKIRESLGVDDPPASS